MFQLRLKELREQACISQYKLAKEIGVSQSTVGMWENGTNKPEHSKLIALSDYFDTSLDYLLGRSDNIHGEDLSTKEKRLISEYRNKPEMQGAIDKLLGLDEPQIIPIKQQNGKVAAFGGDIRNITLSEDDISKLKNITDKT